MMQRSLVLFVCLYCFSSFADQLQTSLKDLARVEYLRTNSPSALVRSAIDEEAAFRAANKVEILSYLEKIRTLFIESNREVHEVKSQVLNRMEKDLAIAQRLKLEFSSLSPLKDEITFSCKANRLVEFLGSAIELYQKRGHHIIRGLMPTGFKDYWSDVRCLGDCECERQFHNSIDLALKASLVLTKLELEGRDHLSPEDITEQAPFMHSTPLPKGRAIYNINSLSLFYNGTFSPSEGELGFVHGGYAFGGQAQDTSSRHSIYGRNLGPQDCSSWVSKILKLPEIMSTFDFAAYAKDNCSTQNLRHVNVENISEVMPGMILVTRKYDLIKDPTMTATLGESGHAQLIIDVDIKSETFLTLEYARNLPELEGFGTRRIRFAFDNDVKAYFFAKTLEE